VYLVDAADRERFPESMRELNGLLSDDGLSTVPFMVLGNKVGHPTARRRCAQAAGWVRRCGMPPRRVAPRPSPACRASSWPPQPRPPPFKIDLPYAVSEDDLRHSLGLAGYTTGKGKPALDPNIRPIEVYMCSVAKRMGYGEGFRWLSQYIK
jgi:GTP-binding protein SAR1